MTYLHARSKVWLALAGLPLPLLLVAPAAHAQSNSTELDPVVVTASRLPQKLSDTLASTTSISQQDIQNSQATDLPSLLRDVAGIEMTQAGGPGTQASLFVRGANSNQVLVLIDGVPAGSATLGMTAIEQIPASQIDHIEIVRGNVSALYGSQAIGGVVQIFTKQGGNHPPQFSGEVGYGSYDTQRAQIGIGGALDAQGDTRFSLNASTFKTNGFSDINPAQAPQANPNDNGSANRSYSAQISHRLNNNWEIGANWFQTDGRLSFDSAFGLPTDNNTANSRVRLLSTYVKGKLGGSVNTRLTVSQGDDYSYNYLNDVGNGFFHTATRTINWQNEYTFLPGQKLLGGYEFTDQNVDSSTVFTRTTRQVNSGYVGYDGHIGRNRFQANVRRDQYSDFGGANSYYLGYGFLLTKQWKLIASASDAFRAPTFNDLYTPPSAFAAGNPNLQPERAISKELGVQYSGALGQVRLSGFETRYSNLIQWQANSSFFFSPVNVGRARVRGAELTYSGTFLGTDVRANMTVQSPIDQDTDQLLDRRARRFGRVSLARMIDRWRVGGEWLVSALRTDGGNTLGGYGVVNLTARYDIDKSWYVATRFDNVFNKDYQLAYSYNTPGRAAYITLGWRQK